MWILLITTIASAILADAGYMYRAPHGHTRLHHHRPTKVRSVYGPRPHDVKIHSIPGDDKSIVYSISYKDYIYVKKDAAPYKSSANYNNGHVRGNSGNGGSLVSHNGHSNVAHSNKGFAGYSQPLTSVVNYNSNYASSYSLPATSAAQSQAVAYNNNVGSNIGYAQLPASGSYSTSYVQAQPAGYAQTSAPYANIYNSYSQLSGVSTPTVNLNSGYAQTQSSTGNSDNNEYTSTTYTVSNNGYAQAPQATAYSSAGYAQNSAPLNNGYSQSAQAQVASNIGYNYNSQASPTTNNAGNSQITQVNSPLDTGFSPLTQVNNAYGQGAIISTSSALQSPVSNNGYGQSVSTSAGSQLNNGYSQASVPSVGTNLNNVYDPSLTSTVISSGTNVNNVVAPNVIPTASDTTSTSYSLAATGATHVDLNTGITQSLISATDSLNNGLATNLAQNNFNAAINPSPAYPPVAPVIHKHIYFHVPPPETEEPAKPTLPPPPPKKNYKILFIKVPSQDSRANLIRLQQQIAQMQNVAAEEKTLIYVLVKKPEEPAPVALPSPEHKPSEHEVYFVKYGGNPFDIASQVNDELEESGSIKSIVPLEPGLVNGQHK